METPTDTDRWGGLLFPFCLLEILAYFLLHLFDTFFFFFLTVQLKKSGREKPKHSKKKPTRAEVNQQNERKKMKAFFPFQLILIAFDESAGKV